MKKTQDYQKASSTTKDVKKEPQWDVQQLKRHSVIQDHAPGRATCKPGDADNRGSSP